MPLLIPHEELSESALNGIIKAFVLQEGTDYGVEFSFEDKIAAVKRQIIAGEVCVAFDEATESATLITKSKARELIG